MFLTVREFSLCASLECFFKLVRVDTFIIFPPTTVSLATFNCLTKLLFVTPVYTRCTISCLFCEKTPIYIFAILRPTTCRVCALICFIFVGMQQAGSKLQIVRLIHTRIPEGLYLFLRWYKNFKCQFLLLPNFLNLFKQAFHE